MLKVDHASVHSDTGPRTEPKWDSLHHVTLMVAIEETFGVQLSPDEIVSLLTVRDIAGALRNKGIPID